MARGWHGERRRHQVAAMKGTAQRYMDMRMRKDASLWLRNDAFDALQELVAANRDAERNAKLNHYLKNWRSVRTYAQIERALEHGMYFTDGDTEDHILNSLWSLDQESERYKKSAAQMKRDMERERRRK